MQKIRRAVAAREREYEDAKLGAARGGVQRSEYAEFLQKYNWDYFITATFRRPRKEPYYALEQVWHGLEFLNVNRAFLGCEPFQSGDLHIHGLIAFTPQKVMNFSPKNLGKPPQYFPRVRSDTEIFDYLLKIYGRARVQVARSHEAVASYCAKYILKQQSRVADYYKFCGESWTWQKGKL